MSEKILEGIKEQTKSVGHSLLALRKTMDDILWYHKVGDIARIDKSRIFGPPPRTPESVRPTGGAINPYMAKNSVVFFAYTFVPLDIDEKEKYPLLVYPHGGVHANFGTGAAHVVRELIEQGYVIVAPEYRGSTGYGEMFYRLIDYGGLEVEDTYAARNWMVENCDLVDPERVGIIGWSHGGLHALMNVFNHPEAYKAAYVGVPVSDLVARMGYKTQHYRDLYSVPYHIGKTAYEDTEEYKRRSPAWNAEKLQTPLLIHTTTNDQDVNVLEVEHLIKSLKAAGKKFEYKIYKNAPGGHSFGRLDTKASKEVRIEAYRFLAKYLSPPKPV